jgi:hypothetical protein
MKREEEILDEREGSKYLLRTKEIEVIEKIIFVLLGVELVGISNIYLTRFINEVYSLNETLFLLSMAILILLLPLIYVLLWRKNSLKLDIKSSISNHKIVENPICFFATIINGGLKILLGALLIFEIKASNQELIPISPKISYPLIIIVPIASGIFYLLYVWKTKIQSDKWQILQKEKLKKVSTYYDTT